MKYLILGFIFVLTACNKQEISNSDIPNGEIQMEAVVDGINQLGWDLYSKITKEESQFKNVVISPASIASAMYMAYVGTANETQSEMSSAMHISDISLPDLLVTYQELYFQLNELETEKGEVGIFNSVFWDDNRIIPHQSFLDQIEQNFDGELSPLDFLDQEALTVINQWVKEKTKNRIEKIIEKIEDRDVMFLINALFLKADWDQPFAQESTQAKAFHRTDEKEVTAPFMFHDNHFSYFQDEEFQAIELPLADTQLAALFISPRKSQDINEFLLSIGYQQVKELFHHKLSKGRAQLHLPKFKVEYKINLNNALKIQGMEIAFDKTRSDFSNLGVSPQGNLYISNVDHRTFLEVDEKGVEGAAVTSVTISADSLPPVLRFDHPFLVVIYHKKLNLILFLGEINDPVND